LREDDWVQRRWWKYGLFGAVSIMGAAAGTVLAVAVNVATGGTAAAFPWIEDHPWRWTAGATITVAGCGVLLWLAQRMLERQWSDLVPIDQRLESWVVDRPDEVRKVVKALVAQRRSTVGITTAVHGAGGFGKTTVAKLVRTDRRVLRRFRGRVYWVTLGRDARTRAAIAEKVNDLIARLDPDNVATFTDPQQAGQHLAALLATGPPRLLIIDDVWYPEQEAAFPVGGRSARVVTTRIPSLIAGECVPVHVDQVTPSQANALLTSGLPQLPPTLIAGLVGETGRWALLLRLLNKILADQVSVNMNVVDVAQQLLDRLRQSGPLQVDQLTGAASEHLNLNDPQQRQLAIATTIEASIGLLTSAERTRFGELAIFAEDETVPVDLVHKLWRATDGLDILSARALCSRLDKLALLTVTGAEQGGAIGLHDVIRDYLREELGEGRLVKLNQILLRAAAEDLPREASSKVRSSEMVIAWWELAESSRYMWDHLIEHLVAADWKREAEEVAADLRWVSSRLDQSGPAAPFVDLALVNSVRCARLGRLLGQTAHLLSPTEPRHSRIDILYSRVSGDPDWRAQATALSSARAEPRLANRWQLPDLPDRALLRALVGNNSRVIHVAVSPNSQWFAHAREDRTLKIWNVATGLEWILLDGHGSSVSEIVFGPDSTWIAAAMNDGKVWIWDVDSGLKRMVLRGRGKSVSKMAVAPDGTWIAAAMNDGRVWIWDVGSGHKRTVLRGHTEPVYQIAVAPAGACLATVSKDGSTRVWSTTTGIQRDILDVAAGQQYALYYDPARRVSIRFSPDSARLVVSRSDGAIWYWRNGVGFTSTTRLHHQYYRNFVTATAPDGTWLAIWTDGSSVQIWDTVTDTERTMLHDCSFSDALVAPDGTWLATAGADGTVRIWGTRTGDQRAVLDGYSSKMATSVVAPNGTWLAAVDADRTVRIWDTQTGDQRAIFRGHTDNVSMITATPGSTWLAATCRDGSVRIWDPIGVTTNPSTTSLSDSVHVLTVAPSGNWFASASEDNMVRIWDLKTGRQRSILDGNSGRIFAMTVAPSGRWLAVASRVEWDRKRETVRIWDVATRTQRMALGRDFVQLSAMTVGPDGTWIATASRVENARRDGTVRVWDTTTGTCRSILRGSINQVAAMTVAPDGTWLAAACENGEIRIWDMETEEQQILHYRKASSVISMTTTPDGSSLLLGNRDGVIRGWNLVTETEFSLATSHGDRLSAMALDPNGVWLATTGTDSTVRITNFNSGESVAMMRVENSTLACAWTPDGQSIVIGGYGGLYLLDFHKN
jgi:WD40 repeat protein